MDSSEKTVPDSVQCEPRRRRRDWLRCGMGAALTLGLGSLAGCQSPPPVRTAEPDVEPTRPPVPPRPPRIGLALGGGAARGFAHVGVLQVLEDHGIEPAVVVGTSAGSFVGALYASGRTPKELAALANTLDESVLTDWSFPGRGVIKGEALARYVREQTGQRSLEQMQRTFGVVATDLDTGEPILFRRGDTGQAVRASSAVPAVFQPVRINGREYVDGGLVSPVPVRYAREMGAELVVAVDISSPPDGQATGDPFRMLLQTFSIMSRSINTLELKDADIVVRPRLNGLSSSDFAARTRAMQLGREAAMLRMPDLKARIAALTR